MRATRDLYERIPVLLVSGDLDIAAYSAFQQAVDDLSAAGDCLIVDLGDVFYVGSTALGSLVRLHVELSERHGALAITSAQRDVRRVFQIAGLAGRLNMFETLEAASLYLAPLCHPESQTA